jgi:hypothetical protein
MLTITNATKAQIIAAINAVLGVLGSFGLGHLTNAQQGSILVAANAVLAVVVAVTYQSSSKRVKTSQPQPPQPPPSS